MDNLILNTKYTPAEGTTREEIERQISLFQSNEVLKEFLGKDSAVFLIVNNYRQIVHMDKGALEFIGLNDLASVIGKRLGELIECLYSTNKKGSCGNSKSYTYCGALNAVLESQKGKLAENNCQLLLRSDQNAFDLRILALPLKFNDQKFTTITLQDIQHEKWRFFLERIFIHDSLNTIKVLQGTLYLLKNSKEKLNVVDLIKISEMIAQNLVEEIRSQQLSIIMQRYVTEVINIKNLLNLGIFIDVAIIFVLFMNQKK